MLDSNVIIDYLAFNFKGDTLANINNIVNDGLYISVITKIEVLGFASDNIELDNKTEQFISLSNTHELTQAVVAQTIQIRKIRKIKMADAIIAATAISSNCILLSKNTKDFVGIKGLKVIDPYTL